MDGPTAVAVADFDNDGDLDIIINNQNAKASLYKNNAIENNRSAPIIIHHSI